MIHLAWGIVARPHEIGTVPEAERSWYDDLVAINMGVAAAEQGFALVKTFPYSDEEDWPVAYGRLVAVLGRFEASQMLVTTNADPDRFSLLERTAANSRLRLLVLSGDVYPRTASIPPEPPIDDM